MLNPRRFRAAQARVARARPDRAARVGEGATRLPGCARSGVGTAERFVVANLHCTSYPPDQRLPDAELLRAAWFADALAEPDEPLVLAGDFNTSYRRSRTLHDLCGSEWGFSQAGPGIDHVLVRGRGATPPHRWPDARRELERRLLSDHAPVEVEVGVG